MAVRQIVRLGHPSLRAAAQPVPIAQVSAAEVQELVDDLLDTLRVAPGVGLAAPQLGTELQVFVFEDETWGGGDRQRVVLNPLVEPHAGELIYDWEGCLSIPGLLGLVPRHPTVRLFGLDREGEELTLELSGFTARVVQHEHDHLYGVLFLDRMRDLRSLTFEEEWQRFGAKGERTAVG